MILCRKYYLDYIQKLDKFFLHLPVD